MNGASRVWMLALFYSGNTGSTIFFGGIARYDVPAGCDISDIFCRYYGILS